MHSIIDRKTFKDNNIAILPGIAVKAYDSSPSNKNKYLYIITYH